LLNHNYQERIGSNGIEEIKEHKFFKGINFEGCSVEEMKD
jgi:hypothetical protein